MKLFKIALGADHAGYNVKKALVGHLTEKGYKVVDFGTHSDEPCDYPDYAWRVARAVSTGKCERGLLACGSGVGMDIAANKVKGIRAATIWAIPIAKLVSQHNWCNVLCLPSRFVSLPRLKKMVDAWLETPYEKGGRHERRVKKVLKIESKSLC